ncbi:MAG: ATP synthase subunit C [Nitrososphaeria archaeon]
MLFANGAYAADGTTSQLSFKELGAAIAFCVAGAAAAIGMGQIGSTGISALAEKPELFSKVLMLLLFVEAIAIYGLVIAFLILLG